MVEKFCKSEKMLIIHKKIILHMSTLPKTNFHTAQSSKGKDDQFQKTGSSEIPKNKAIFLDRDGVLNQDKHYVYKLEDLVILP